MAILRAELQGEGSVVNRRRADGSIGTSIAGVYEGIIESAADLLLPRMTEFSQGSIFYCMENKRLYVKCSTGEWMVIQK